MLTIHPFVRALTPFLPGPLFNRVMGVVFVHKELPLPVK